MLHYAYPPNIMPEYSRSRVLLSLQTRRSRAVSSQKLDGRGDSVHHHHHLEAISETATVLESRQKASAHHPLWVAAVYQIVLPTQACHAPLLIRISICLVGRENDPDVLLSRSRSSKSLCFVRMAIGVTSSQPSRGSQSQTSHSLNSVNERDLNLLNSYT